LEVVVEGDLKDAVEATLSKLGEAIDICRISTNGLSCELT
jgi:hypothetical protein